MTTDMTCSACRELAPFQVAGQLTLDEQAAVERHVATCPACQREISLWSEVALALAEAERALPPDTNADAALQALCDRLPPRTPMADAQAHGVAGVALANSAPARGRATPGLGKPAGREPRRRYSQPALAASAAAVLIVALIATLLGVFGGRLRQARTAAMTPTATPSACASDDLRATLPAGAWLQDLSMTSPRAGWAVGAIATGSVIVTGSDSTPPTYQTLLLGFQNCQWAPVGASIANAELTSVSMVSATDGWAVGVTQPGATGSALLALHYTGGAWQRVSVPAAPTGLIGAKVRMTSAGDGWMLIDLGKRHVTPYQAQYSYALLHYQDGAWTPTPLSFDHSGAIILWDIAADSPDDCWIVGYTGGVGDDFAVAHYHQGAWTTWSDQRLGMQAPALYAIALAAPNDVWIAGSYGYQDANGDHSAPLVMHYDGAQWTRAPVGDFQDETSDHTIMALAVNGSGEVWAFTQAFGGGLSTAYIAHEVDGVWTWTPAPAHGVVTSASAAPPILGIGSAAFISDTEAFAPATTLRQDGTLGGAILHYVNGAWSVLPAR